MAGDYFSSGLPVITYREQGEREEKGGVGRSKAEVSYNLQGKILNDLLPSTVPIP